MSFRDGEWKKSRSALGFSQRFHSVLSKNYNTATAEWEKSKDGQK
jgi:hypothetical protein